MLRLKKNYIFKNYDIPIWTTPNKRNIDRSYLYSIVNQFVTVYILLPKMNLSLFIYHALTWICHYLYITLLYEFVIINYSLEKDSHISGKLYHMTNRHE